MSKAKAARPKGQAKRTRPGAGTRKKKATTPPSTPLDEAKQPTPAEQAGLEPQIYEFCITWLANGFNASAAYKATHPKCLSDGAARTNGWRTLTKADVKAFLAEQLEGRWSHLHMSGEEVLARVAMDARADPRLLFDAENKPLKPQDWPDEVANSIERVKFTDDGAVEVRLVSKAAARRTILEATGKLAAGDGIDQLAKALTETMEANAAKRVNP